MQNTNTTPRHSNPEVQAAYDAAIFSAHSELKSAGEVRDSRLAAGDITVDEYRALRDSEGKRYTAKAAAAQAAKNAAPAGGDDFDARR